MVKRSQQVAAIRRIYGPDVADCSRRQLLALYRRLRFNTFWIEDEEGKSWAMSELEILDPEFTL